MDLEMVELIEKGIKITAPSGKTLIIRGTTVCVKGSPEKCIDLEKKIVEMLIDYAWHHNWRIEKVE